MYICVFIVDNTCFTFKEYFVKMKEGIESDEYFLDLWFPRVPYLLGVEWNENIQNTGYYTG